MGMAKAAQKRKTKTSKPRRAKKKPARARTVVADGATELQVKGGQLVVRLSRDSHPEVFDLDRLSKEVRKMIKAHGRKRKNADLNEFLVETEKSLQIILRNHLEDAMRKYLG